MFLSAGGLMLRKNRYKSQLKVFKLYLNFPPDVPHQTILGIFGNFEFPKFFLKLQFTIVHHGEIKNLKYLENKVS